MANSLEVFGGLIHIYKPTVKQKEGFTFYMPTLMYPCGRSPHGYIKGGHIKNDASFCFTVDLQMSL